MAGLDTAGPALDTPRRQAPSRRERLVIYCQTTGVSAAHATHCATYCTPVSAAHTSIFRMDSNANAKPQAGEVDRAPDQGEQGRETAGRD